MGCNKGEIELGFLNMSQVRKYIMYIITYNVNVVGKYCFVKIGEKESRKYSSNGKRLDGHLICEFKPVISRF